MLLEASGFTDVTIGEAVDTFGGAKGEANARTFEVYGYAFLAFKTRVPLSASETGRECDGTGPCTTVGCE